MCPAVNEPGTASSVIATSTALILDWFDRSAFARPQERYVRLHVEPLLDQDLVQDAFREAGGAGQE
ncbi:DUF2254 domain-containing protein [Rubellimicrobium roseum]|uniref:DUF2254 domain-containing protein n=1 Tax=Rubellimicrobium roseum TaxID=687525 RepID=A0A5C4N3S1_9RHOB|nr:DUF2254 domain-containing protein [Rubellimicrobium roseum]